MTLSGFIARRYFFGRKRMFAAFLSFIAVSSVTCGVFALLVVMSVMNGFSKDLREKLIGFSAHIVVSSENGSDDFKQALSLAGSDVASSAVIIEGEGIIQGDGAQGVTSQGVKIRGIDETDRSKLQGVDWFFGEATVNDEASNRTRNPKHGVLVGSELAYQLGVNPDWGDTVELIVPLGRVGPTGELMPEKREFAVKGLFRSGYFDHDSKTVIVSKKAAKELLGDSGRIGLNIWLRDAAKAQKVANLITESAQGFSALSWEASNRKLFAALKLEKFAMAILMTLIVCVACISIVSVVFMYVFLRRRDIAVLASCGMTRRELSAIFIKIGAIVGFIGSGVGTFMALLVLGWLIYHPFALPSVYYLDRLPVEFSLPMIILISFVGVFVAVASAIYPAWHATMIEPRKLLRYE